MTLLSKIIFILLLLVFAAVFALLNRLCYLYTKTANTRRFLLDPTYWCFATINYEFCTFENTAENIDEFIESFAESYLFGNTIFHKILVTEKRRQLLEIILSNPNFIITNFGVIPYNTRINDEIVAKWNEQFMSQENLDSENKNAEKKQK